MNGVDAEVLRKFVHSLPRIDYLILFMSYADGLSVAEIAAVLDMSESHVTSRLGKLQQQATSELRQESGVTGQTRSPTDNLKALRRTA